jgi:hypothetical protein
VYRGIANQNDISVSQSAASQIRNFQPPEFNSIPGIAERAAILDAVSTAIVSRYCKLQNPRIVVVDTNGG